MKKEIKPDPTEEAQPISPVFVIARPRGKCRLFTDGWRCDCGEVNCWHVEKAKAMWESEQQ